MNHKTLDKKMMVSAGVGVVLVAIVSFFGGIKYNQSRASGDMARGAGTGQNRGGFFTGQGGSARGGRGGGLVAGSILSTDDKSVTIKNRDGGSKIVFLSASSVVLKSVTGSIDDLVVGAQAVVTGTPNSDGTVTAQSIQIRPNMAPIGEKSN